MGETSKTYRVRLHDKYDAAVVLICNESGDIQRVFVKLDDGFEDIALKRELEQVAVMFNALLQYATAEEILRSFAGPPHFLTNATAQEAILWAFMRLTNAKEAQSVH